MALITPDFRGNWVFLLTPQYKDKDKPENGKAYSIQAFFPPTADLREMEAEVDKTIKKKFGSLEDAPANWRSPFRKVGELDNPPPSVPKDWITMRFSMNEFDKNGTPQKPGVVDENVQDIIDPTKLYSGAWFRAQVNAGWYNAKGNKGVSFYLQNVMKVRDDEPLGAAKAPANKAFESFKTSGSGAGSLFD